MSRSPRCCHLHPHPTTQSPTLAVPRMWVIFTLLHFFLFIIWSTFGCFASFLLLCTSILFVPLHGIEGNVSYETKGLRETQQYEDRSEDFETLTAMK